MLYLEVLYFTMRFCALLGIYYKIVVPMATPGGGTRYHVMSVSGVRVLSYSPDAVCALWDSLPSFKLLLYTSSGLLDCTSVWSAT